MENNKEIKLEPIENLINTGSEIVGSTAGSVIGFLAGGPLGAVLGGASGPLINKAFCKIGQEIKNRLLGHREEVRIGATISYTLDKMRENIEKGIQIRTDNFFEKQPDKRSSAEEILEGILLASQREYQEKKLQYYGNLMANIVFRNDIDVAQANLLLSLAQRLSYRQLCLISVFARNKSFSLRKNKYEKGYTVQQGEVSVLQEVFELYIQGLINSSGQIVFNLEQIVPDKISVQGTGHLLFGLMELRKIKPEELNEVVQFLK